MRLKGHIYWISWSVVILILCLIPGSGIPDSSFLNIPFFDKWVHAGLFGVLAYLMCAGIGLAGFNAVVFALIYAAILGGMVEWMQDILPYNRSAEFLDWLADMCGFVIVLLVVRHRVRV